jgi:hypothetical protein
MKYFSENYQLRALQWDEIRNRIFRYYLLPPLREPAKVRSRANVRFSSDRAYVYVSGEYLQNRNLNEVAHDLALDGLNAFPGSRSFYVEVQDSKARGSAEVRR